MKRLFLLLLFFPQLAFSQYNAKFFCLEKSDNMVSKPIRMSFSKENEFAIDINTAISGFSITGKAILENDNNSYIRVTLKDDYNYEHLVYENYPMVADELSMEFNNTAIETVLLDNIKPKSMRVECHHATLELNSINYIKSESPTMMSASKVAYYIKSQGQYIVEKLNSNLEKRKALWRAGETSVSKKTFEEKKAMFGGKLPELYGFEYYKGGIFVIPKEENLSNRLYQSGNRDSNNYVSEWDWRNRHGKNWMTSVKNQGDCGSCWAFAALGTMESYINLYYNQCINYDLSEEELISCSGHGCDGGKLDSAYIYVKEHGIVKEICFPYVEQEENCDVMCQYPSERVGIDSYQKIGIFDISEERMKQQLFKSPIALGLFVWGHGMVVAGYKVVEEGDSIHIAYWGFDWPILVDNNCTYLGDTAWLVKNSWGSDWGDGGYAYITTELALSHFAYLDGDITSLIYNDDNIICEDADGDGFYFWGVGPKPSHCPSWVPDTPDGDDSNINYGPLDSYGFLETLPAGITINTPVTYAYNNSTSYRLGIVNGGILTITGTTTLTGNSTIRVCEGGILIVDGGVLQNANIEMIPGSQVIVKNNGKIVMGSNQIFKAPQGVIVKIESGSIE